ncbi:lipocalin family protein [Flavobacterium wongokense]|uniref:lipocalin family protein n=1 Tax=Flavobacterium wongokense TaxID=2910674 RepID=UPI001F172233|nr:lipocalin family protein [Flavobacterium sp. WG47]MCF6132311.1 lipocalin family protein [Flavobacterium sp. WG47]
MRKIIPAAGLILIALLFNGCSVDEDNNEDLATFAQIQGKWKLTEYYSDDQPVNTPIPDGYEIEFNEDKTFTSNEIDGYSGGNYRVTKEPGKNIQLTYRKQWDSQTAYKYIDAVDADHIYLQESTSEPTHDGGVNLSGYVLTRVP